MEIGIQQLQLGKELKSKKRAINILKTIKELGCNGIELNGFMIRKIPYIVKVLTTLSGMSIGKSNKFNWLELINNSNLKVISIHEDLKTMEEKTSYVIDELKTYSCHYVVLTGMYKYSYMDVKSVRELISRLNKVGEKFYKEGISFLYHNHNVEFQHVDNEKRAYDLLIEETDPKYVNFEFDSYWPSISGIDAIYYMNKLNTRMKLHHICDNGSEYEKSFITPIIKTHEIELGKGNLNLEKMIKLDREYKVDAVILEQHKNFVDGNLYQSVRESIGYLKEHSVEQ